MPKLYSAYPVPLNILMADDGTKEALRAVAYFRGEAGHHAGPARDFIRFGLDAWVSGLSTRDRARYDEILANVRAASAMKAPSSDTLRN